MRTAPDMQQVLGSTTGSQQLFGPLAHVQYFFLQSSLSQLELAACTKLQKFFWSFYEDFIGG